MQGKKILGIMGGMGPAATVDLFGKIVSQTRASCDQEHIHVIVDDDADIPDRRTSIVNGDTIAGEGMLACARRLEAAGADILMIGCNTAHCFYDFVQQGVDVPVLHMPRETAKEIARRNYRSAGILGTDMTIRMGLYHRALETEGVTPVEPDEEGKQIIMDIIYNGIKAGKTNLDLGPALAKMEEMKARGAECFILGCTELPVAFANIKTDLDLIDPTNILARAAIRAAGYEVI
jgi:aspartate racemase